MAFRMKRILQMLHDLDQERCSGIGVEKRWQHEQEFVAALATDGVSVAHAFAQSVGGLFEKPVANGVSQGVVDGLEVVEVELEQRNLVVGPIRECNCLR